MSAQHTPGPWQAKRDFRCDGDMDCEHYEIFGSNRAMLAYTSTTFSSVGITENAANARLIAAAPELLDSLIEFVQCNDGEHSLEMYQRARSAIAKAEGRHE